MPLSNSAVTKRSSFTETELSEPNGARSMLAEVNCEDASNCDTPLARLAVPKLSARGWGKRPVDAAHGTVKLFTPATGAARVPSALKVRFPVATGLPPAPPTSATGPG